VEGGGCSGFQYEFTLEEEGAKKGDQVYQVAGTTVLCDDVSMEFLKGATVDFESDLMRSAFVVSRKKVEKIRDIVLFSSCSVLFQVFNLICLRSFIVQVHDNPNADSSCGCGSSFAAK
jgi:Fe-S cluster assembly iron-binding protein IscA